MSDRRQLQEQYEDALFALLMDSVAEQEGEELLREVERLNNDPSAAVPRDLDRKCRKIIRGAKRKENAAKTYRVTTRVLKKVAIAVVAAILLLAMAYAIIPEVRTGILNLLMTSTREYTQFQLGEEKPFEDKPNVVDTSLYVYSVPKEIEGFELVHSEENERIRLYRYKGLSNNGMIIRVEYATEYTIYKADAEEVDMILDIQINGYNGAYVEKGEGILVTWVDTDRSIVISVLADGIDSAVVLDVARSIELLDK